MPYECIPEATIRDLLAQEILKDYQKSFKSYHIPHTHARRAVPIPKKPAGWNRPPVGIIGAGAAGLYAGMILQSLGIPYEILEADERIGGRLYTHKFSEKENDYYDVGSMRYPDIPNMRRIFDLFDRLGFDDKIKVNYVLSNKHDALYFNGQLYRSYGMKSIEDPFRVSQRNGGNVPDEYVALGHEALIDQKLGPFKRALVTDFNEGWKMLMEFDDYSTRAYMTLVEPKYPKSVVDWCETMDSATSLYDCALSESVMDSLFFDYPSANVNWFCIQGGGVVIANAMAKKLIRKPETGKRVQSICPSGDHVEVTVVGEELPRKYSHVISTLPLSCLRMVDTEKCNFSYSLKTALRTLHYDSSVKIGIKFDSRWWEAGGQDHKGGKSMTDRPLRTVVYPSYGIDKDSGAVLLASYTWSQDAMRLGAFAQGPSSSAEKLLIKSVLEDLAVMHGVPFDFLEGSMRNYHIFDWYNSEFSCGAFALFGPGQFTNLFKEVTQPAANGLFHFAGEATSVHHAWLVGALNSAYRAVDEALVVEQKTELRRKLENEWKRPAEVGRETTEVQVALAMEQRLALK